MHHHDLDIDFDHAATTRRAPVARRLAALPLGRVLLTVVALGAIAAAGVLTTRAAFSDDVTMAQIHVTGGSLDIVAGGDTDDTDVAWTGAISVDITGMLPGDEETGTVEIENAGDVPFTAAASTSGTDASGCFAYYLRETSVSAGTGAAAHPVNITGMGTAAGGDGTTAAFATPVVDSALADDGADLEWEPGDAKVYTMTVRMLSSCATNAADGTLDVSVAADQA